MVLFFPESPSVAANNDNDDDDDDDDNDDEDNDDDNDDKDDEDDEIMVRDSHLFCRCDDVISRSSGVPVDIMVKALDSFGSMRGEGGFGGGGVGGRGGVRGKDVSRDDIMISRRTLLTGPEKGILG